MKSENEDVMFWTVFGYCIRVVLWIAVVIATLSTAAMVSGWLYTIVAILWCCYWIARFWVFVEMN